MNTSTEQLIPLEIQEDFQKRPRNYNKKKLRDCTIKHKAIIVCIILLVTGVSNFLLNKNIKELESKQKILLNTLSTKVIEEDTINSALDEFKETIETYEKKIDDIKTFVTETQASFEVSTKNVNSLKEEISQAEEEIKALDSKILSLHFELRNSDQTIS